MSLFREPVEVVFSIAVGADRSRRARRVDDSRTRERPQHMRHLAFLSLLAMMLLAAVDVRVPVDIRAPMAVFFLLVALAFALNDPLHSVRVTHPLARVPSRSRAAHGRVPPRIDRMFNSGPRWL